MRNVWTIFKKEFSRVVKDKRMVLSIFILPGLMIYIMYSVMGANITTITDPGDGTIITGPPIVVVNVPSELETLIDQIPDVEFIFSKYNTKEQALENLDEVNAGELDMIIIFEEDFHAKALALEKPQYEVYYNPTEMKSSFTYQQFMGILNTYDAVLLAELDMETTLFNVPQIHEEFDENSLSGQMMGMMLPFLIIAFLFSGAMSIGPESISGEKERGTIATLLVTPTKRGEIAFGKIMSLSVLSLISALSSFLGVILSLPKLLAMDGVSTNIYGVSDYLLILAVLAATVLVIVSMISIISAFAKSVKEAGLYIAPLFVISMIIGAAGMFNDNVPQELAVYFIPIYNSIQVLRGIFTFQVDFLFLIVTVISNIVYTGLLAIVLRKMFDSETIMFAK